VRGSNENRPKILVGDLVRLRPLFEDLDARNKKHCPYIMQPFELTGSVLSFKLANETCIVDFSIPAGSSLVRKLDYSGDIPLLITADTVNVMNGLRYHVRFTFERCGLAFTHKGSITFQLYFHTLHVPPTPPSQTSLKAFLLLLMFIVPCDCYLLFLSLIIFIDILSPLLTMTTTASSV
jgi:hypothetical protein